MHWVAGEFAEPPKYRDKHWDSPHSRKDSVTMPNRYAEDLVGICPVRRQNSR